MSPDILRGMVAAFALMAILNLCGMAVVMLYFASIR